MYIYIERERIGRSERKEQKEERTKGKGRELKKLSV